MDYTEQYSEWLSAYLDGELEPALEEPLFAALATHAELRQEMGELLALRRAVRNDRVALVPPLSTSAALFQSIGIGAGTGFIVSLLRKVWMPLAGAIVGSALTWLGMTQWGQPSAEQSLVQRETPAPSVAAPETTIVERVVYRTRTVYRTVPSPVVATEDAHASTPSDAVQQPSQPAATARDFVPLAELPEFRIAPSPLVVRRYALPESVTKDPAVEHPTDMPTPPPAEQYPQFRLFLRGLGSTSLVTVPQQPDRSSLLNTSAIGLQYTLSDHHAIGIEVGREPFAMQFYGYSNETRLRYEAYPALLWGTATYQWRTKLGKEFEPFVQVGIGATEFGLLGRTTVGIVYRPTPVLGVMLGAEGALMRYVYQSVPYWTPNVGITYGVVFRF